LNKNKKANAAANSNDQQTKEKEKEKEKEKNSEDETIEELTEEEEVEKEELMKKGFADWTRREFNAFIKGCERFGRDHLGKIAESIETKTEKEVKEYATVFWKRYKQINDWERLLKNIEKGESKIQRVEGMIQALDEKVKRYKNPWQELKVVYGQSKGKQAYTEEEDQFLVCATQKLGYGSWDELKLEIRKSWQFKFDWFLKSRTPQELNRRVDILIRLIEKENQENEKEEREAKKAKKQKKEQEK